MIPVVERTEKVMLRNTQERWGSLSIGLHWTIAALVLLLQVPVAAHLLPRGPGREPLSALRRGSFVIITRKSAPSDAAMEAL